MVAYCQVCKTARWLKVRKPALVIVGLLGFRFASTQADQNQIYYALSYSN
jgi:hypothetical protein